MSHGSLPVDEQDGKEYLQAQPETLVPAQTIYTTAANCFGAKALFSDTRYEAPCAMAVNWWDDANVEYVASIHDFAAKNGYVLIIADESAPIIAPDRLPQPLQVIKTFPRPDGQYNVVLYCAGAATPDRCPSS
ncbi:MAG: hypothetical protein U0528_00215 [Anaerolineae bacterium]